MYTIVDIDDAAQRGMCTGREAERAEIIALMKRAIEEADDKMFRSRDAHERRNFAAVSVGLTRMIDLIGAGEHRDA